MIISFKFVPYSFEFRAYFGQNSLDNLDGPGKLHEVFLSASFSIANFVRKFR